MIIKSRVFRGIVSVFMLLGLSGIGRLWAQLPPSISYSGTLTTPQGDARQGTFTMTFRIFDQPAGGTNVYMQTINNVVVRAGQFSVVLSGFSPTIFQGAGDRYIEVQVSGESPILPRQRLINVPFSLKADRANSAGSADTAGRAGSADTAGRAGRVDTVGSIDGAQGGNIRGGLSANGTITGSSTNYYGVYGYSTSPIAAGVYGQSDNIAVSGYSPAGTGVYARNNNSGATAYLGASSGYAGDFYGNVRITGRMTASSKQFKIDHPLDPANKYLYHTSVESPDMKNIYDGVIGLDANGEASVTLPDWFEALNRDFRYQITAVGAPGPNLYVAEEVSGNRFKIAGGQPGSKVSWQVTGIRKDPYAERYRTPVEEDKPAAEKNYFMHPEVFDQPATKSVEWRRYPNVMQHLQERREPRQ